MGPRFTGRFAWMGRRPGWSGLAGGIAIGVAATLLATTYLVPRLGPDERWESGTRLIISPGAKELRRNVCFCRPGGTGCTLRLPPHR